MKKLTFFTYIAFSILNFSLLKAQDSIIFSENFDNTTIPENWSEKYVTGSVKWQFRDGGYSTNNPDTILFVRKPPGLNSGSYNAMFQHQTTLGYSTKLITPQIPAIEFAVKPELRFSHAQYEWFHGFYSNDELRVYYKNGTDSAWIMLEEYTEPTSSWIERNILLPDSSLTGDYYIGFEGKADWGFGTCIDNIQIVETGVADRYIDTIYMEQPVLLPVSSGLANYQVFKLVVVVKGNENDLFLNSINLNSLNTSDADIKSNGVKMFYTNESKFSTKLPITSGNSFSGGNAQIDGINYKLETGLNYFWITYDIDENAMHGHQIDGKIPAGGIDISGSLYPSSELSPTGSRTIYESVYYDNFETDLGWTLVSEFEIDQPDSLGGRVNIQDPDAALSGNKVLGTDLTGLGTFGGDYEKSLVRNAYTATSPSIDLTYYKDINIRFKRWLNIYFNDTVAIEVSNNGGATWTRVWENVSSIAQKEWSTEEYNISSLANRTDSIKVRFCLGGTDTTTNVTSGWNIEDFSVTGDYIANDVGVLTITAPVTGCGHSATSDVTAIIKNYGPSTSEDTIPVAYSIDGGTTFYIDTLFGSIPFGGTTSFTFPTKANLTTPGIHDLVLKTVLSNDEFTSNDQFDTTIYIVPTVNLPYAQDFESNNGFWRAGGNRDVWEWGIPQNSFINDVSSGQKAWVTDLNSYYQANDSVFLESPCFNLSGTIDPILDCKVKYETKRYLDGAAFYYSIDDGASWKYMDTLDYQWDWEWYEDTVASLGKPAMDSVSDDWMRIRQFLPLETHGVSNVKFRLLLAADTSNFFFEGIGMDDFQIFNAPVDIGISDFVAPDSACELSNKEFIKVAIKNYSITTLPSGTVIPLGFDLNGSYYITDTLLLTDNLLPNDTVHFTFMDSVDMFSAGKYYFDVYTLHPTDIDYYNASMNNDTLSTYVSVYGMPAYDLGPSIGMDIIDTLLDAGLYTTYDWENGDSTTRYYHVTTQGMYNVTITNEHGCVKSDSVRVLQSTEDLGVTELISPLSDCEFPNDTSITVKIQNFKGATYGIGDTIVVAYQLNRKPIVIDSIFLASPVGALESFNYTFNNGIDLSSVGSYNFIFYTVLEGDLDYSNDTLETTVSTWGYPDVELGANVIYTLNADTIKLNAGSGFDTYTWQNGSVDSTFQIPNKRSKKYHVTVTDAHGCGSDSDTVQIIAYDMKTESILAPVNSCSLSDIQSIQIRIRNMGADTLAPGTIIPVSYSILGQPAVNENFTLVSKMDPTDVRDITFTATVDMSTVNEYDIVAYTSFANDINAANDTFYDTISNWGYPVINLAADTLFTGQPDTVILVAGSGYTSYYWGLGETDDSLHVSQNISKWYVVDVTNSHGCLSSDSTYVFAEDLGISAMIAPVNNCVLTNNEEISVRIWNYSESTLPPGTVIPVAYTINGGGEVYEEYTLPVNLYPLNNVVFNFATTADLSFPGNYNISTYTKFKNDVDLTNDTNTTTVQVYGNPEIDLGMDTTIRAISYVLDAGGPYASYLWQDSSDNQIFTVNTSGKYKVTVENGFGCISSDSINIILLAPDLSISRLVAPAANCYSNGNVAPVVRLKNTGTDTIQPTDEISIKYLINTNLIGNENFVIGSVLLPQDSIDVTFSSTFDMFTYTDHEFEFITDFDRDIIPGNDTIHFTPVIIPFPSVELGEDIIVETKQHLLKAGSNENYSYLWQDNTTTDSNYIAEFDGSLFKTFSVTVTDERIGCSTNDDITLTFNISDIELISVSLSSPICQNELLNPLVTIKNTGVTNLTSNQRVQFGYLDEDMNTRKVSVTIGSALNTGSTKILSFSGLPFIHSGSQNVKLFVNMVDDADYLNDTLEQTVSTNPAPISGMGGASDTLFQNLPALLSPLQGQTAYKWHDSSTGSTITAQSSGWYWVDITGSNGCLSRDSVFISGETAIFNFGEANEQINVFPVPTNDFLFIRSDRELSDNYQVYVINFEGKVIYNNKLTMYNKADMMIDMQDYIPGIYLIKIVSTKNSLTHKIIKE